MIKPLPWQEAHLEAVAESLRLSRVYVDTSSTGAGKTILSLLACKRLGAPAIIVCPHSVLSYWQEWAVEIGVDVIACMNYERILSMTQVTQRYYDDPPRREETARQKRSRVKSSSLWREGVHPPASRKIRRATLNLSKHPEGPDLLGGWKVVNREWHWNDEWLEDDPVMIFDEAHRLGGRKSKYHHFLEATKDQDIRTLCLSATIADTPLRMKALAYRLGLIKSRSSRKFEAWCELNGCDRGDMNQLVYMGGEEDMREIKGTIGTKIGGINTREVPDFPASNLVLISAPVDKEALDEAYAEALLKVAEEAETEGVASLRARQLSEWLKRDWCVSKAQDIVEGGSSVAIFVSFKATGDFLAKKLKCDFVCGETKGERAEQVRKFQANESHYIVIMCQAGGESISLHDLHGRPRATIVMPNHNATEFVQVLGRVPRAKAQQSSVTQYIVFARGCQAEARVRRNLRVKSANIRTLTDNDLSVIPDKFSKPG